MPIQFDVRPGTVLLCDYGLGGFRAPEMVKRRPAIVISPRLRHRDGLCAVVPLSGSSPERDLPYIVRIELPEPLPEPFEQTVWWVKCDMVATVGFSRLDQFRAPGGRQPDGKRRYIQPKTPLADFARVRDGILAGLGFG